jgi:hypothetical protein
MVIMSKDMAKASQHVHRPFCILSILVSLLVVPFYDNDDCVKVTIKMQGSLIIALFNRTTIN